MCKWRWITMLLTRLTAAPVAILICAKVSLRWFSHVTKVDRPCMAFARRSYAIAASFLILLVLVPSAHAEKGMSCQGFRLALWRAIDDGGNKLARPEFDKRAGGFGPTTRYEMTEIVSLEGQLICWKDQIFNFSATARLSSDPNETAARVLQFKGLAAAAICTLSSPQSMPQECASQADALVRLAMDEYAKPHVGGEDQHYGGAGVRLDDGSRIEMEAREDSVTFFLYLF